MDTLRVGSKKDMVRLLRVIAAKDVKVISAGRAMNIALTRTIKKGSVLMCTEDSIIELNLDELEEDDV